MDINPLIAYAVPLAELAVLIRLRLLGLVHKYVWFTSYLAAVLLREVLFSFLRVGPASPLYAEVWLVTEPIVWIVKVLMVWELYRRVCEHYRNFKVTGKLLLVISALAGVLLCALTVRLDLSHMDWKWSKYGSVYWTSLLTERCLEFSLAAFLAIAAIFFVNFRVPIRKNVLVHGSLITLLLALHAAAALAYILRWNYRTVATVYMVMQMPLLLGWVVLLSKRGETVDVWPGTTEEEYAAERARTADLIDIARKL